MDTPVSASQRRVETLSVLDVLASGSSPSQDYTIFLNDGSTKHWAVRRSHQELFRFCQHLNDSYISNEIPRPSESFDPENTKAFLKSFPGQHQSILRDFLEIKEGGSDYEIPDPAKVLKSGQLQIFQGPRVHVILTQLRLFVFPQSALESSVLPKEAPIHDIIVSKSAALLQEKVKVVIKGVMNDIIFLAASESEAKAWLASFTSTCFAPAWFAKIGAPEREGIEAVKKLLKNENAQFIHRLSDMDILRFLREKGFDVEKTLSAIHYDQLWRKQFRSDYLTAANVYTHLKTSKFIFPGTFDKQSRPIIVFKAGRHDPNTEFMETLKLAIYAFEIAYRTLLYSNEVIVVEDLDGFDRDKNADNRMVKLLLEIVQAHFPERIGRFFAVNAPWYYKLLFKVVKPWLSSELAGKVSIATDPFDTLKQYVAPDQLIKDLGGSCVFDFNDWILQRCFEERVSPRLLENPPVHNIESDLLDCISDISVAKAKTNGLFEGWMKKQGGFVKNFNKRYCVLTPKILYYYKEENDPKAEGFMDLKGASVQKTGSDTFQVVTSSNKIGIFSCSSKHIAGWVTAIQQAISNIPLTLDPFDDYYDQDQDFYNPSFDKEIAPTPSVFPAVHAGRSEAFQIQPARAADEPEASDLEKKIGDVVWTARNGPGALAFADVYVDSKLCRSSFTGESLVVWMQKNSFASTSAQAADLCAQMINNESLRTFIPAGPGFNPAALYYFQEDVPTCFLNNFSWSLPVRSPQIVAASLAKRLAECVAKHTINGEIHQKWLANSRDFRDFKVATGELQRVNLGTLSPTQQALFFLNIYNLLSLHAQIAFGTPTKYQARNFLISMSYNIGGRDFTLDDILHGILLGNSRALPVNPSRGEYSLVPVFGPGDDRAQFATRSLTNSQSVSIILGTNPQLWSTQPSNVFYDVEANVDEVLKGITEAYLTKGIMIDEANQKVLLPRAIQILRQRLCPVGGPKELFVQLQEACKPSTSPILDRFTAASPLFSVAFVPSPSRL